MMTQSSPLANLSLAPTVTFAVIGQLLVKQGMLEVGGSPGQVRMLPHFIWQAFINWRVLMGLACAIFAAVSWMIAVSRTHLSLAYPFMGLAIVLVLTLSGILFGEDVPITRWLGAAVVCVGILIAAQDRVLVSFCIDTVPIGASGLKPEAGRSRQVSGDNHGMRS